MIVKFVYGFLPAIIIPVKRRPEPFDARTKFFVIKIWHKRLDDKALLEHELTHVRQFWRTFGLHFILYKLSKRYRFYAECEAYANQCRALGSKPIFVEIAAKHLTKLYNLNIGFHKALRCIYSKL